MKSFWILICGCLLLAACSGNSKISNFFMILGLLQKQWGDYCFGRVV
jgi:hypothetical protein